MIHSARDVESKDKILVDCMGRHIQYVSSFDDETNIAELYVPVKEGGVVVTKELGVSKALLVRVKIEGAKIVHKEYNHKKPVEFHPDGVK